MSFRSSSPGLLVPQRVYSTFRPYATFPSITFRENGSPGVQLASAFHNDLQGLEDPYERPILTSSAQKITLRVNVRVGHFDMLTSDPTYLLTVARLSGMVRRDACI